MGILLWLLLCSALCAEETAIVIEDQGILPVLTPSLAEQKTLKLRLKNGLEAYIISNPHADKSGAALVVEAGSWDEPDEYPGLAHFLEHMLFMGTKKYPDEKGYASFIENNGGQRNGYTASDHTMYTFSVNNDAFIGALDRFSNFFSESLLDGDSMDKERHAVDQEYAKNVENDNWRLVSIRSAIGNKKHPASRFSCGNMETLKSITPEVLRQWYEQYYSADKMHLAIYSSLPLEELRELVIADFSAIPVREVDKNNVDVFMSDSKYDGYRIYVVPVHDRRKLEIRWEMPFYFAKMIDSRPGSAISYIMGHEGEESLLAQLKREGLASSLSSGVQLAGQNNSFFVLEIGLTDDGLDEVNKVIERCAQMLNYLREHGVPEYIFDEIKNMQQISYQYQLPERVFDMVEHHAYNMMFEDLSTYPMKTNITSKYDPYSIEEFLDYLTLDRAQIFILAPSKLVDLEPQYQEPWMGGEYAILPVDKVLMNRWCLADEHTDMAVPPPNDFIPDSLQLVNKERTSDGYTVIPPKLLVDDRWGKFYFEEDKRFLVPQVDLTFNFLVPATESPSARNSVLLDLYLKAVDEQLNALRYRAYLGGLSGALGISHYGLSLQVSGYSDKARIFLKNIIDGLKQCRPTEDQFELYKNLLRRAYKNAVLASPLDLGIEVMQSMVYADQFTCEEKLSEIENISYKDFLDLCATLYSKVYIQALLYGNLTEQEAKNMWEGVSSAFQTTPLPKKERRSREVLHLQGNQPMYVVKETSRQGQAVLLMIEDSDFSFKRRAAQQMLARIMKPMFYHELRTKQQTAYVVSSWDQEIARELMFFFVVLSSNHGARDLLTRFEIFIENFLEEMPTDFTPEDFDSAKKVLIENLTHLPNNLDSMALLLRTLAFEYDGDFNWMEKRRQGAMDLTYEEFLSCANEFIGEKNKKRLAILIEGLFPKESGLQYKQVNKEEITQHYFNNDDEVDDAA